MSGDLDLPPRRPARNPRRPAAAGPRASGGRQGQKEATRKRVIEAARELFDTQGYQGTTIREIARHAGVSVGSVFTTFASKGEVLSQVMEERLDGLYAELDRVVPHLRGSTADKLRTLYAMLFAFEEPRTKLFLSHIAAAYDWTLPPGARPYGANQRLRDLLHEIVCKGMACGDVDPQTDVLAVVDLLVGTYAWTYHLVVTEGADARRLTEVMDQRIGLIADGFRPR
ncbi:TetR/AcrR family transcriptional regulator [Phenylobacterium soli]|uniref:TetR/AcrR family transcriptional regulator n=1 Tax=Phenylobacterium soli TaxID=2170551 RepID=A0A328AII7_9CAUL|nr:TetR/AcrR family transcriptional regulator [Phenylobacterium soli]RAK53214.1 TetR/AcrR family transcriptional regulator [Phenylobacterium soli]